MASAKRPGDDAAALELDRMTGRILELIERERKYMGEPWPQDMRQEHIDSAKQSSKDRIMGLRWCERMLRNRATRLRNGTASR